LALAIVTDCYGKIIVDEHNNRGTSVMLEVHQKIASLKWFHISVDEQASCELELEKASHEPATQLGLAGARSGHVQGAPLRHRDVLAWSSMRVRIKALRLALTKALYSDVEVGTLVLHERLGVGLVRGWDEERKKWEIGFFGHRRLREASAIVGARDEDALSQLTAHFFTAARVRRKVLLVPPQLFRMAVMEVFQSDIYQAVITFCVFGNTLALTAYHFNIEVFMANYIQAMWNSCYSVLPSLPGSAFSASGNYTQLWEWRNAVQTSANISVECAHFIAMNFSQPIPAMPASWQSSLDTANNAFSIVFLVDLLLGLVGAVSTQPKAQLRASFDAVLSVLTVVGLAIPLFSVFAVLRLFTCLFRLARLFRMRQLERNLLGLGDAMAAIIPLMLLLGFFIFFFAILGVQFFGPYATAADLRRDALPTPNWASMGPNEWGYGALMTVVQILTGEGWSEIMYTTMTDCGPFAVVFFIALILLGTCAPSGASESAMQLDAPLYSIAYWQVLLYNMYWQVVAAECIYSGTE
jgi:hypothetical protein